MADAKKVKRYAPRDCVDKESFVKKAMKIHSHRSYSYDEFVYVNAYTKSKVKCNVKHHGFFYVNANSHTAGKVGCKYCPDRNGKVNKFNTDTFIEASIAVWGDALDYKHITEFTSTKKYYTFVCKIHDVTYEQKGEANLNGTHGCVQCRTSYKRSHKLNGTLKEKYPDLFAQVNIDETRKIMPDVDLDSLVLHSDIIVIWNCRLNPAHTFAASVLTRFNRRTKGYKLDCSTCTHNKTSVDDNLEVNYPEVAAEWNYEKNNDPPSCYRPFSSAIVWWVCPLGHEYELRISYKTGGSKCIVCFPRKQKLEDRMDLIDDIDSRWSTKNEISPSRVSVTDNRLYWFKCKDHGTHEFQMAANSYFYYRKCIICEPKVDSLVAMEWLRYIQHKTGEKLQCKMNGNREHRIPGSNYRVDGHIKNTKIAYDFYGDYWHANPKFYDMTQIHPNEASMTYGDVYKKTIERENYIKSQGYQLITIWEHEWVKIRTVALREMEKEMEEDRLLDEWIFAHYFNNITISDSCIPFYDDTEEDPLYAEPPEDPECETHLDRVVASWCGF